jgi:hypothetical protein
MDGVQIQARVDRGFAIAARKTGVPHELYRPTDPLRPLSLVDRVATIPAAFDARPSLKFQIPALHADAERYALVSSDQVQPGDYLVGPDLTVFVASKPTFYSAVCIACNATLTLRRLANPAGFGAIDDRSDAVVGEQDVWRGWPASLRFGGRGGGGASDVPGDMSNPEFQALLPKLPDGVPDPRPGDVLVDQAGRRMAVGWAEWSELGWRILARLMTAG